uniref:Cytochrome b6 n=2 Tax=Chromera velia TaxID=505693 RepID=D9IXG3_9ALVE|nr:cytochrome b6 [Chromera velia]ADJ66571.1 cytochrome b6 [Chromera velia]
MFNWLNKRIGLNKLAEDFSTKFVPPHVNIFYCLGGITFISLLIQIATGAAMTFYYKPSVVDALSSVDAIMNSINFGWLVRSLHKWSASMMVLSMILHIFRVFITGGFKAPRELTWVTGVLLAILTVSFGVTGYSLPWDQVGYWACKIVTGVPEVIPFIGPVLVLFLRGDVNIGQYTLTRFYSLHTFFLPFIVVIALLAHFLMIRNQGISGPS